MEVEGEDGSKTLLKKGFKKELGRGLGLDPKDRTVSRRHVSLELHGDENRSDPNSNSRVHFQVIGRNPIWVYSSSKDEVRVFRRSEGGELEAGDKFCISSKEPVWFALKRFDFGAEDEREAKRELGSESELAQRLQSSSVLGSVEDLEINSVDVSEIDPVKEFGFLVMGHEFDHYPKQMIRHVKSWDWFLEDSKEDSRDDEVSDKKGKKSLRKKRKKDEANDDEEWTGESEDDKELITKLRKVQSPRYSTRSKDRDKPIKNEKLNKTSVQKKTIAGEDDEDEEDDTLGGFIAQEDDVEEVEEEETEEEEEEEEEDYEDDDEEE